MWLAQDLLYDSSTQGEKATAEEDEDVILSQIIKLEENVAYGPVL